MEKENRHIAPKELDEATLLNYIRDIASKEENARVEAWLKEGKENEKVLLQVARIYYAIRTRKRIESRSSLSAYFKVGKHIKRQKGKIRLKRFYVAAACFVGVLVLSTVIGKLLFLKEETAKLPVLYQTLYVPAGQRAELILPDSTKVWVNAHSRLVYPISFTQQGDRQVKLDGEAYFSVRSTGEKNSFIVKTERMDIKVLGTEFNVSAYSDISSFEVSLLKGHVELSSHDLSDVYQVSVGEHVLFKDGKFNSFPIKNPDYFKWREGLLCFDNQPISEIVDKLRLYYDIRIEVADQSFLTERYSGKFRVKDGIEQVLKVLQLEHKFSYVKDNELNLITIK